MTLFTRDKKTGAAVPLIENEAPTGKAATEYTDEKGRVILHMTYSADGKLIPLEDALKLHLGFDSSGHAFRRSDGKHVPTECVGVARKHHFPEIQGHMSEVAQKEYAKLESGSGSIVG